MAVVLFDGVAFGMLLFLISVGLSITMGLMNFVNLAHGSFAMVGGYTASTLLNQFEVHYALALGAAFLGAAVVGAVLEVSLYKRLYRAHPLDQVLLSIGVVFVSIASFSYLFGPSVQPSRLPAGLDGQVALAGIEFGRYRLFLVICGLSVLCALLLMLSSTRYGAMIRAAVDNKRVAAGIGINVRRLFLFTFSIGCGLAGLGGALSLGMLGLEPSFPLKYMVFFLMVVCLGGAGSIVGPFIAALVVGVVDVAGKYYLPEAGAFLIYVVLILVLLFRPQGIVRPKGLA
jgi:branched-chain amino acid transport system permease protein